MSEDCLYLNVYAPERAEDELLPVMVWIHGGGYDHGHASEMEFNASKLAAQGIIVVCIQYRVNLFGFLALPELSAENEEGVSGNYGTLDQIKALEWVNENIEGFGGDPENVTICGQSAGAMSVTALLSTDMTDGLFNRAIIQSGFGGYAAPGNYKSWRIKKKSKRY
ncbi:MAG: carboxylesterase family protein [Anaeromassilibacillus sp.]